MEKQKPKIQTKETISTKAPVGTPISMNLKCTKTINNYEKTPADKNTGLICLNGVAWNQNPQYSNQFVTVDDQSRLTLYKTDSDKPVFQEQVSNGMLVTVAIEPRTGQHVLCGGIDTKLSLYNINRVMKKREQAKLINKQKEYSGHQGLVTSCGFLSPNHFVSGSNDSIVFLWDIEQTKKIAQYNGHSNEVLTLDVFQMDGNVFASGSSDLSFRIWDIRQRKACLRVFEKNKCGVSSIKFMPENINTLAVGYEDHSIKIWDLRALGKVGKFKDATTTSYDSVKSLCFSKSGRLLFAAYNNNCIKVWDLLTELKVGQMSSEHETEDKKVTMRSISLSEDGSTLLSVSKDGRIQKWQMGY